MKFFTKSSNQKFSLGQRGVALLLVLFVISLLIIISAEFAFTTRMETNVVRNFKEDMEGYYYAVAGFQYAVTELLSTYDANYLGDQGQLGFYRAWYQELNQQQQASTPKTVKDGEIQEITEWPPVPNRSKINIGDGYFDYIITDEEGRLNINYLDSKAQNNQKSNREVFRELLVYSGVEDGEPADIIIDSILDWTDRNDEHHLNGAESDWYERNYKEQGFSEPYSCKNSKLDCLDELLMVRGMSPQILYGSDSIFARIGDDDRIYAGIAPYITVYGFQRSANPDTAPPLLLQFLDSENAQEIMDQRKDSTKAKHKPSKTFRIEVSGYKNESSITHSIIAVVRRSTTKSGGGAEILYWNDQASSFGADMLAYSSDTDYNPSALPGGSGL